MIVELIDYLHPSIPSKSCFQFPSCTDPPVLSNFVFFLSRQMESKSTAPVLTERRGAGLKLSQLLIASVPLRRQGCNLA